MSITKVENVLRIHTYTPDGEQVEDARELSNVPMAELFPNEPVCLIDWLIKGQIPSRAELEAPVLAEGCEFIGHYGWGSAVKRGQTIGLTRDLLAEVGLLRDATRGIMTGRMLLNQGTFGGLKGTFRIQVVDRGTVIAGNPVDDGHSLLRRDLAELGYDADTPKIVLGKAKQSYSFWQRIPWSMELQQELLPIIQETIAEASDPGNWDFDYGPAWEEKQALIQLDERMQQHPYVAPAFLKVMADYLARAATTVDVPTEVRVAVPTTSPIATVVGPHALTRYPVDSNGSTQAVEPSALDGQEFLRVSQLEVVQYTVASKQLMAKGCFGVVDELPDGVDLVLCLDDIKMTVEALDGLKHGDIVELEAVIPFHQWFAAGCAIGINSEWAKDSMGLDFDGDMVFVMPLHEFPMLLKAIRGRIPGNTPKLEKVPQALDKRVAMIRNSMANLVGLASNVAAGTFAVHDRRLLASQLGFAGEAALNDKLNWYIKVGTDGFKTMINQPLVEMEILALQGNLMRVLKKGAVWTRWPNEWAFRREVPKFQYEGMSKAEARRAVPIHFDGTIPMILRLTLPDMQRALQIKGGPIDMLPLSTFRGWAGPVPEHLLDGAHRLQLEFNARVTRVNFTWADDVIRFKKVWAHLIQDWMVAEHIGAEMACAALWREAHSTRSDSASAASVFMAFPELCKAIVEHKPGLQCAKQETVLVGLGYVFDEAPTHLVAEVEIREFRQERANKTLIRRIAVGNVPGKKDAKAPYPAGLIGMVEVHANQPELGTYVATITKAGHGNAWHCKLS